MLGGTHWNPSEPVQICPDPFEPVETRSDLLKHVQTCWNTFRPVETRFQASPLPLHPLPLLPLPLFPFLWGGGGRGREGEGGGGRGGNTITGPRRGGGRSPPPLRILTKNYQNSLTLSSLCVIYPRGFSLSPQLKTTKLMAASQQNSLWHTSKNKYYMYIPPK